MKTILLSGCLLFTAVTLWSQQSIQPPTVMSLQQYRDSLKKRNEAQLKMPLDVLKKKQTAVKRTPSNPIIILPYTGYKNVMPIWYPDSNYVYNMPGTYAYDQTKAKGGVFFVPGKTK